MCHVIKHKYTKEMAAAASLDLICGQKADEGNILHGVALDLVGTRPRPNRTQPTIISMGNYVALEQPECRPFSQRCLSPFIIVYF